jgi:hypothetical protein
MIKEVNMRLSISALILLGLVRSFAVGAESPAPGPASALTYADLADLSVAAPVAARVRVRDAIRLSGDRAVGVPPGRTRFYMEADIVSLLRAPGGLPPRVRYLADMNNDAAGKPPRVKRKAEYLILGTPVPGRPGELKLVAPDAQLPWSQAYEGRLREIVKEVVSPDAPPRIVGVGRAFHVPGTLPGESETQLFLVTADRQPISLTILRRPGVQPSWAVALGEIVDEAAEPPRPNSLLWYRLACGLPQSLPPQSLAESDPAAAAAIRQDYALVLQQLGACTRSRRP